MLRQRVITAVILLAVLLPALWAADPRPIAALTLLFVAAASWEWGRLNGTSDALAWGLGGLTLLLGMGAWLSGWPGRSGDLAMWSALSLAWVAGGAWLLGRGLASWAHLPRVGRLVLGVVVLWSTWLAMMNAKLVGLNFMLSIFCLAWVADISAYFGGRAFGRRKLAPSISPGKSWEGVAAGVVGTLLLAGIWIALDARTAARTPSLYTVLFQQWGVLGGAAGVLALTAMTVVGDLCESVIKRVAGMKDSSNLLPGHGGVLDRVDALLPLFPLSWTLMVACRG